MGARSATRDNGCIRAHYRQLVARGRAKEVALIAGTVKPVTGPKAIFRDRNHWFLQQARSKTRCACSIAKQMACGDRCGTQVGV